MRKTNNGRKSMRGIRESINGNINVDKIAREVNSAIKDAVKYVDSGNAYPTWSWFLDSDDKYNYELVLGFSAGFEPNENEFVDSYGDGLCMKWARIPKNSAMNEYDIDYEMPYDEVTGDVWDSENSVAGYDETDIVEWLIKDFKEYAEQNLYVDESLKRNSVKENSMKLKIREVRRAELSPSYDSRKSFYGKAHVVTDDDGTEILYSYDTPVVKIKDGKVELLAQWDSSQTTLRHVKEFLQQNGFKVGSKAQIAKMYGRAVESVNKHFRRKNIKEAKENTNYVVFRKYYNEYTDSWEPIAFYWGDNISATYGRINITEQDGNVPYRKTPRYVHDEADINYVARTKKLTPNDECYNDFTKFVIDELEEDGYNVIVKQKVDNNAVRNSWK